MSSILLKVDYDYDKKGLTFLSGKLYIVITYDEWIDESDSYSFSLYNDWLWQIWHAEAGNKQIRKWGNNRIFNLTFDKNILLLPGHYFMLFRMGETVVRFDLKNLFNSPRLEARNKESSLNKEYLGRFMGKTCPRLSMEDILEKRLSGKGTWKYFSRTPGLLPWKQWVIHRLQQRELNVFRSENKQWMLEYCDNMLIATEQTELLTRNMTLLCYLAQTRKIAEKINGSTFCSSEQNSYEKIGELFKSEWSDNNPLGVSLPVTKDQIFVFYNIGKLLQPDMKDVLDRILENAPTTHYGVAFCGKQEELDKLLELQPQLQNQIPEYNRFGNAPCSAEELILCFFDRLEAEKVELAPKAVDAFCKMLYREFDKGRISNWTFSDMRHYITCKMIPAYTQRAIASIQAGGTAEKAAYIQPEDLVDL